MAEALSSFKEEIRARVLTRNTPESPIISDRGEGEQEWLFDFRAVMLEARWLDLFAEEFWRRHGQEHPFQVGGMEAAGIPLVAAIVMKSIQKERPVNGFFIRKSRKKTGLLKQVEGTLTKDPVFLVDDLINSDQSIGKQLAVLEDAGVPVRGVFAILGFRDTKAYSFAHQKNISVETLFSITDFGFPLVSPLETTVPHKSFETLWRFKATAPSLNYVVEKSAPALDETRVYFGTDSGIFFALNQEAGSAAWEYKIGTHPKGKGIFSSPALLNGTVFFGAYDGNVYALDATTGKKKWSYMEADWVGSSPALAPDLGLLYIGLEFGLLKKRGGIAALSLATGKKAWDFRMPEYTHGTPLYIEKESAVAIGSNDGALYCFDAKNGALKWKHQTRGEIKSAPAYDPVLRLIVFGSFDSYVYALHARDGSLAWSYKAEAGFFSTPLITDNAVYIASLDKHLYALHLKNGALRWKFLTGGRIFSSPVYADGSLWIGSNDGRLYEMSLEGKVRSFFQTSERVVNAIAWNPKTKRLFVPTVANELYCLARPAVYRRDRNTI